ncbi:MAG: hypothetical protein U5K43_13865 [Halofilum sp. (in: g-proteobacteria)]|nr:hypothetical protein [Halofilum sp. (in: g-proteobacteria)]
MIAVKENLVTIRAPGRIIKNEVAWVHVRDRRLMAEVLRAGRVRRRTCRSMSRPTAWPWARPST